MDQNRLLIHSKIISEISIMLFFSLIRFIYAEREKDLRSNFFKKYQKKAIEGHFFKAHLNSV